MTTPTETPNPTPEPTPPVVTPSGTTTASITLTREELDRQLGDTRKATERELKNAPEYKAAQDALKRLKDIEEAQKSELDKATERATKAEADREVVQADIDAARADTERYKAALTAHLETQLKDLPAFVLEAIADKDPVEKLAYLSKHGDALRTKNGSGIPATPKPGDKRVVTEAEQQAAQRQAAQLVKSRF